MHNSHLDDDNKNSSIPVKSQKKITRKENSTNKEHKNDFDDKFETEEICVDCDSSFSSDNIYHCTYCSGVVCNKCYIIWGRDISCTICKKR